MLKEFSFKDTAHLKSLLKKKGPLLCHPSQIKPREREVIMENLGDTKAFCGQGSFHIAK